MLRLKLLNYLFMAISRRLTIVIVVAVAISTVTATFLLIESQKGIAITPLSFTFPYWCSFQFDEGYLNITVGNRCNHAVIIREVNVSQSTRYKNHYELISTYKMFRLIPVGEEVLIRLRLNWTSGYAYQVSVMDNNGYSLGLGAKP